MNVAIVSRLRRGIGKLGERLAGREDGEHIQAMVRITFGLVISAYLYITVGARFNILVVCIGFEVSPLPSFLRSSFTRNAPPCAGGLGPSPTWEPRPI